MKMVHEVEQLEMTADRTARARMSHTGSLASGLAPGASSSSSCSSSSSSSSSPGASAAWRRLGQGGLGGAGRGARLAGAAEPPG